MIFMGIHLKNPLFRNFTVNAPDYQPNYWLTALLVNKSVKQNNEGLRQTLLLHGIEARPVWKPLHLQPYFW